jgi:hypothetical protein
VFDKEALYKSVEQVMAEAVNAQMQVAQAVVSAPASPLTTPAAKPEEAETPLLSPQEALVRVPTPLPEDSETAPEPAQALTVADLFQRHGSQVAKKQRKPVREPEQLTLFALPSPAP